jgi:hypothetical protein
VLLVGAAASGGAQAANADGQRMAQLEQKIEAISSALTATEAQIAESQRQMKELQGELVELRREVAGDGDGGTVADGDPGTMGTPGLQGLKPPALDGGLRPKAEALGYLEAKANDAKANDTKADDARANDAKANDTRANDAKANDGRANDGDSGSASQNDDSLLRGDASLRGDALASQNDDSLLRGDDSLTGGASTSQNDDSKGDDAPGGKDGAGADPAATMEERVAAVEAEVKLHEQTKVESGSKYAVRLKGLILFNSYLDKGVADNTDLPGFALKATSTSGDGNLGATLRQTVLGVEGFGPRVIGARTSANVSMDFFSTMAYSSYWTSAGVVRMRTAAVDLDWDKDSVEVGMVTPLIAPLAPTSVATVAEPSLAGAGDLWTWAPQLKYTHRFALDEERRVQFEFGLWDSPEAGYNGNELFRTASPAELAQQPAYETRLAYAGAGEHGLQLGVGGYYSRQAYPGYQGYAGTEHLDSWAGTFDARLPLGTHFELSGEGYRGRALGGLGGGEYKDVVTGTDPVSGASVLHGLNAIGGWAQWKTRFTQTLETNLSLGEDDGLARDFHAVVMPAGASATQLRARNEMLMANLIFRPKTYIILSPEYRRIWSWPIAGTGSTLDVFTLSAGYQF